MGSSRVIVEVSPSALEVALCRGNVVTSRRRVTLDRAEWPTPVSAGLDDLKAPLLEAVAALGCAGRPATIVYTFPGTFVTAGACPRPAGPRSALQAARLSLASIATFPLDANPHDARVLHEDLALQRNAPASELAQLRIHTIAAADADPTVSALTRWAEAAGLCVDSVVPAEVVIAAAAVAAATGAHADTAKPPVARAVLWMGTHQSVLAVGSSGRLELVRTISAGAETIVDALLRPIRGRGGAADAVRIDAEPPTVTLDRAAARRLLASIGIPAAQAALPDLPGFDGSSILPLLQPVLQRLAIEIKQSLRFGTNETTKAGLSLCIAGDGASIPNLGDVLCRQVGITAAPGGSPATEQPRLTTAAAAHADRLLCLLGGEASDRMLTRGLRRGLIIGASAAAVLLGVEGFSTVVALSKEQERLAAIKANAAGAGALAMVQQHALNARVATTSLSRKIADSLGQAPDWSVVMSIIAERTPPSVRIMGLDMSVRNTAEATCSVRGYVRLAETHDPSGDIRRFVDALGSEPLVSSVKLGVTQRANVRGHEAQTFELTIALVSIPLRTDDEAPTDQRAAAAPSGHTPTEAAP